MSKEMKIGLAVFAVLILSAIAYALLHKPAPVTHTAAGPTPDTARNPIASVAAAVKKAIVADSNKKLKPGDRGIEVSTLQDNIGEYGTNGSAGDGFPGISSDGVWGQETTVALTWLLNAWKLPVGLPDGISINDLDTMSANPVAIANMQSSQSDSLASEVNTLFTV